MLISLVQGLKKRYHQWGKDEKTYRPTINDLADNDLQFRDMDLSTVQYTINVLERWRYQRMLRISWTEHVTNKEVFNMAITKPTLLDGFLIMHRGFNVVT